MRLILTEYISSLKEDRELDSLIQDILRAYKIAIFAKPEKGRQHGVDIYAVGQDFEDGNKKKVFLITVKQGDVDRQVWSASVNSIYQSLEEIKNVFIRNNLAAQHKTLPIKIVVAFNGLLKPTVQQDWRGYTETNSQYEYIIWDNNWLVEQFEQKLLNDQAFSNEIRSLIRKTIIYLENADYDLKHFTKLLELVSNQYKSARTKKGKLKILKELQVIVVIILKYCEEDENLYHAIRLVEKYILVLGSLVFPGSEDADITRNFVTAFHTVLETYMNYYHKIGYIGHIPDGFSLNTLDPVVYTYKVYQQVGIFAMAGLVMLQLKDILNKSDEDSFFNSVNEKINEKASQIAATLITTINHNNIFYTPRADEQHIEISLLLIFLYRMGLVEQIRSLLGMFNRQMGEALILLNIFPEFLNNKRTIAELEVDYNKRKDYKYQASNLYTILTEWCVIVNDENNYRLFRELKELHLKEVELMLWFPENETEGLLYTEYATLKSGYALSNITLPEKLQDYKSIIQDEFTNNCHELNMSFIKQGIWSTGLIASRHFRTYIFPFYWRQFLSNVRN